MATRPGARLSTRRTVRGSTVAALFVLGLAQLCALLHAFVVPHSVCPEHGEAVHVSARELAGRGSAAVVGGPRLVAARPGAEVEASPVEHEHCSVSRHRTEQVALQRGRGMVVAQQRAASDLAPLPLLRPGPVPLYRVAPKSSPPA